MPFETYKKGSAPVPSVPSVTIQKRGLFSLNRAAFNLLGNPQAIAFLWDADRKVIGLQAVEPTDPNGYPTRPQVPNSDRGSVLVAGTLFTQFIGLDTAVARRWAPSMEGGILCIDLNTEGHIVVGNRRSKRSTDDSAPHQGSFP